MIIPAAETQGAAGAAGAEAEPFNSTAEQASTVPGVERPIEMESLCMRCMKNGVTKLLSITIPFYRQIVLMSFACEHCGFQNSETQSGEPAQEFGSEIVLCVKEPRDLNRSLVKSEYAGVEVPELQLEIPSKTQPGEITTVEGVLMRVRTGLHDDQPQRRQQDPESAAKIDAFIERLDDLLTLKQSWTLKLRDPSGNCHIENPDPNHVDPRCITSHYHRKREEEQLLGFVADGEDADGGEDAGVSEEDKEWKSYEDCKHEVMHFKGSCQSCGAPVETLMKPTDIPHFQTVIIMSTCCDHCGYKSNEVKSGGATQEMGCRLSLSVEEEVDLARDVLKSDTCYLLLPELDIEMGPGVLASRFTTVEGLLSAARDEMATQCSFFLGDSAPADQKAKLRALLGSIDEALALKRRCTLVMDDPAGNSYIMSLTAPLDDARLHKHFYTRTYEQNDELGLNDMRVENYQQMEPIVEGDNEPAAGGQG